MQDYHTRSKESQEIDLNRTISALLHKLWLIVAVTLVFGILGYVYSATAVAPKYRASFTAYVNNRLTPEGENKTSTSDLSASVGLTHVYKKIVESRTVQEAAVALCGQIDVRKIVGVTAQVSDSAPVLTVYAVATDPLLAKQLADALSQVAPEHVAQVVEGSSMKVIDEPVLPSAPYSPNKVLYGTYSALLGLLLSVALVIVTELSRDYVQGSEDLENRYGIPVIGKIPDMLQTDKNEDHYGYGKAVGKR